MKTPPQPADDVRMKGFRSRVEVESVLSLLDKSVRPLGVESVALSDAAGRVLAEPITSEFDIPPFDRAAMDGFAVRGEDTFGATEYNPLELKVIGEVLPGRPYSEDVHPGQSVRIMTGARLPAGADAVLMAEHAEQANDIVRISEAVPPGRHVGRRGEDISAGTEVFSTGRVLRPQDVGALSAIGMATIPVYCRPRVSIIITGDELLPPGSKPEENKIVDSNSVMLRALVLRDGGIPVCGPIVPDQREDIRRAITESDTDVLLISGGSSVGSEDYAPIILSEEGSLPVHGVAMRPSSPTGVGFINDRPVFLLPGNPVSCLCAYDFFAGRTIRATGGRSREWPYPRRELPLGKKLVSAVGRVDYVRVKILDDKVEPLATSGASILSSTTRADGFVIVPGDSEGLPPGEIVDVFLYDSN